METADWIHERSIGKNVPAPEFRKSKQPLELATLTPLQSTKITGFGVTETYRLLKSGEMPCIKNGRIFRIPRYALMKWLETRTGR